ncbi:MAG: hypothetical protein N2484_10330 [Clostridia bacterium]|nr:hypothetical protein [Clostridia bacterium]
MGFKEKMMEGMMGSMSSEERKEMMDKMMENFFSNMTKEEKQEMMNNMMPKMMGMMMGGSEPGAGGNMMGSMMKSMMGGGSPMMSMMGGKEEVGEKGFNPMDMCKKMMSTISQSSEIATFATPEVRQMFEEWVQQVDEEILNYVNDSGSIDPEQIAAHLKISKNSVIYFLSRLAQKGKLSIKVEKQQDKGN